MPQVTVKVAYFGPIRQAVQVPDDLVVLPAGSTVRQLVSLLRERHGEAFCEALFFPDGEPLPTVTMLFDGRDIRHSRGLDTRIEGDRVVTLVVMPPPLGGG